MKKKGITLALLLSCTTAAAAPALPSTNSDLRALEQNKAQFLMLPGFQPLAAHIAWREGDEYGMRFDKPLHISVFEHIARSFPGISGGAH